MSRLWTYDHFWPESFATCPPDRNFVEYMESVSPSMRTVFHFGTGGHHTLGTRLAEMGHATLGITASVMEYDAYEELAIERPDVAARYKCLFGDIYQLNPFLLPQFDYVCLFHLYEHEDSADKRAAYGAMDDEALVRMLVAYNLKPDGALVLYPGSNGYRRTNEMITRMRDVLMGMDVRTDGLQFMFKETLCE